MLATTTTTTITTTTTTFLYLSFFCKKYLLVGASGLLWTGQWVSESVSHRCMYDWIYYKQPIKFLFLVTRGNLTLTFHKGVNSASADELLPLVPTRCLLFLVTNGNLTLLFFTRE